MLNMLLLGYPNSRVSMTHETTIHEAEYPTRRLERVHSSSAEKDLTFTNSTSTQHEVFLPYFTGSIFHNASYDHSLSHSTRNIKINLILLNCKVFGFLCYYHCRNEVSEWQMKHFKIIQFKFFLNFLVNRIFAVY